MYSDYKWLRVVDAIFFSFYACWLIWLFIGHEYQINDIPAGVRRKSWFLSVFLLFCVTLQTPQEFLNIPHSSILVYSFICIFCLNKSLDLFNVSAIKWINCFLISCVNFKEWYVDYCTVSVIFFCGFFLFVKERMKKKTHFNRLYLCLDVLFWHTEI